MIRVLVVADHPDDEVLGCGGALVRRAAQGDEITVLILSDGESSRADFDLEYRNKCLENSCKTLGVTRFLNLNLKDGYLDDYPITDIVRLIEKHSQVIEPQIIYTHSPADLNIDHQVTHRAVMNAFRGLPGKGPDKILCFEIPSSTEWNNVSSRQLFTPNHYIEISQEQFVTKMRALHCYEQEIRNFPHPRSEEYIHSLMKVRGGMVGTSLAEAFVLERSISRL